MSHPDPCVSPRHGHTPCLCDCVGFKQTMKSSTGNPGWGSINNHLRSGDERMRTRAQGGEKDDDKEEGPRFLLLLILQRGLVQPCLSFSQAPKSQHISQRTGNDGADVGACTQLWANGSPVCSRLFQLAFHFMPAWVRFSEPESNAHAEETGEYRYR